MTLQFDPIALYCDGAPRLSAYEEHVQKWLAANERRFSAVRAADGSLEISILDVIGSGLFFEGVTAKRVKNELDAASDAKLIKVLINSPGGVVSDGLGINALLKRHAARVEVEIIGEASSAASVIAMAGDHIAMHEGTLMMVHRASWVSIGNAEDMRHDADTLDKIDQGLVDIYVRRTGRDEDYVRGLVNAETFMTAHEAVANGFADAVLIGKTPPAQTKNGKSPKVATNATPEELRVMLESEDPRVRELARDELTTAELSDFKASDGVELSREDLLELAASPIAAVATRAMNQLSQRPRVGLASFRTQPARRAADYRK